MKTKLNSKKLDLCRLSIDYRENILMSDITEVSPNGVWCETLNGERNFITRSDLRLMAQFLLKVNAYETEPSNV